MANEAEEKGWVEVQRRTFTKWVNNHLRKKGFPALENVQVAFEDGVALMHIVNALYSIKIPNYNKNPKLRPQKLDNINLALKMVEDAHIKTHFLKNVHLIDHDLKMILGMIWAIILDYAIKGISQDDLTAKEGLLLWCQKKTAGYREVDPPGVQNFSTSWKNGMALCALIHKHRPDLIPYDSLSSANARDNVELAFKVAEEKLGISRLLEVDDLAGADRPDERSVMTYISEFFHRFAMQDIKQNAARKIGKFLQFMRYLQKRQEEFEMRARALIDWCRGQSSKFHETKFGDTLEDAIQAFHSLRDFVVQQKPNYAAEKLDVENLFAELQTELTVNQRPPYTPPAELSLESVEAAWNELQKAEAAHGQAVRQNRFRFIHKAESAVDPAKLEEIKASFRHFDKNGNNTLDKVEFKAACSALGVPFKDEATFEKIFKDVSGGAPSVNLDQYILFNSSLAEDKDTPEQIKAAFATVADEGNVISENQLAVLLPEDRDFLLSHLPKTADGNAYDYSSFVDKNFTA